MAVVLDSSAPVNVTANARAPLAQWALDVLDAGRFERGGRGPIAFDCMGLATWAQHQVGRAARDYLELYRDLNIRAVRDVNQLLRAESEAWRNVDAGGVGDVLVLGHGRIAHHVAVLCGGGRAVHALEGAGIRIDEIEGRAQVRKFAGMRVFGCVSPN